MTQGDPNSVGPVPPRGVAGMNAGSGDPAYNGTCAVGRVAPRGVMCAVPTPGGEAVSQPRSAGLGNPAYKIGPAEPPPRRLRRLTRVWPNREGTLAYLLTVCVEGRARVLANEATYGRLTAFLLDSPTRYGWFPRRFVLMPDHLHLIAHSGPDAVRLGQWIKALKAVVGGLEPRAEHTPGTPGPPGDAVGRVPTPGDHRASRSDGGRHELTRIKRFWRWQDGFHDHKFRTPESEQRKWEYVCLNPVRYGLVARPEEWPFGGEVVYDLAGVPTVTWGTPPLLETGLLMEPPDESTQSTGKPCVADAGSGDPAYRGAISGCRPGALTRRPL